MRLPVLSMKLLLICRWVPVGIFGPERVGGALTGLGGHKVDIGICVCGRGACVNSQWVF